jgi:hypothetical protein
MKRWRIFQEKQRVADIINPNLYKNIEHLKTNIQQIKKFGINKFNLQLNNAIRILHYQQTVMPDQENESLIS